MCDAHPGLERGKRMFHGLSAFAGSIWSLIQAALHSLEYGFVLPA